MAADVVVLVYSVGGSRSNTDQVQVLFDLAKAHFGELAQYYLVCNVWEGHTADNSEGQALADKIGAKDFISVNSKSKESTNALFD